MPHQALAAEVRRLVGADGLCIEIYDHGCVRRIDHGSTMVNLFLANALEPGPTNLYLRIHSTHGGVELARLLGPSSGTRGRRVAQNRWVGVGMWQGIRYSVALQLSHQQPCWFWHVNLENTNDIELQVDVIYTQDVALAPYGSVRLNEYYVSQYVDHTPLEFQDHGWVVASRQNLAAEGRNPWCVIGSLRNAVAYATDALQVHGLTQRGASSSSGLIDGLPATRLQHEHSMVALQDERAALSARGSLQFGFYGATKPDHPAASSTADLLAATDAIQLAEAVYSPVASDTRADPASAVSAANWFTAAPALSVLKPSSMMLRGLFPGEWRHKEIDSDGSILSFFYGADRHVVLRDKELRVQRPHGHLLRTGRAAIPDESALTSTTWMAGVFNSMLTQGHVSINRLLSTVHSYVGLFRSYGQRVFVDLGQGWRLLDVPSAFEMTPSSSRWIYAHAQGVIEVRSQAHHDPHELRLTVQVQSGPPMRCLIAHHIALNGDDGSTTQPILWSHTAGVIELRPQPGTELHRRFPQGSFHIVAAQGTRFEQIGCDELLFLDGHSRQQPYLCVITGSSAAVELHIRGHLIPEETIASDLQWDERAALPRLTGLKNVRGIRTSRLAEILPWFAHNALIHYLAPRGLEQSSGGGWGTRDVTQGPVELLLALGNPRPIRDLLIRVMAAQNADGDWPQWFMFFERERNIRAGDSHGDIVFWPVLALAQYLVASGDAQILDEQVSFYSSKPDESERASVWDHAQRALAVIRQRTIEGTSLAAYGHGDWNDSLQPADPAMREHMCSAWTVTLHHQLLTTLALAFRKLERADEAEAFEAEAQNVRKDFQRWLVVDSVLTGYALFDRGKEIRYLLHPRDQTTGVRYSALAMIHAILEGMFSATQAQEHLQLIAKKLTGPDGVRLFDEPMAYRGGPQYLFQRAESATFFGREIGLMYMHAHLRYAQALAFMGEAEAFFEALCQANPICIRDIVSSATIRQSNCYYSSSDAAFADRYEASARYEDAITGKTALDGGWRVYSSGAGIALGLIVRRFLGVTCEHDALVLDPVMPADLDGLTVQLRLYGYLVEVSYQVQAPGYGVRSVIVNDRELALRYDPNPYRQGVARVAFSALSSALRSGDNRMSVRVG
ncbi:MAG: GH36-type glycosyl hydrolase domain-containing protein [Povalibacter sp.]